ncbi:MAG: aminotransferase class IV [Candidatus Omnitrophica bacterium]|nr:aminotransferase class IV [Candidatus Omnitrophota bacterium]
MTKQSPVVFLDDHFIKPDDDVLASLTPGHRRLHGVFETMKFEGGRILFLKEHLTRLFKGLKALQLSRTPSVARISRIIRLSNGRHRFVRARLRLMVWQEKKYMHWALVTRPYELPKKKVFRVTFIKTQRLASARLANVKSLDYGLFARAFQQAQRQGFDEALLINARGYIFEASRANIFWVKKGRLYTPPLSSGCLNGIMRQQVMKYARQLKIPFEQKNLTIKAFQEADTVFLTNSLIGIKPVKSRI